MITLKEKPKSIEERLSALKEYTLQIVLKFNYR